jgi:1,4-dihydroxy-2-naphthoate octaprenyltransferase
MEKLTSRLPGSVALFLRLTRPLFLLGGVLLYALGAGIANYQGKSIDWNVYWLGQACVTLLQLSAQYLNEYFDAPADQDNPNRTPFSGGSGVEGLPRRTALMAALTTLTIGAVMTVLLTSTGRMSPTVKR